MAKFKITTFNPHIGVEKHEVIADRAIEEEGFLKLRRKNPGQDECTIAAFQIPTVLRYFVGEVTDAI